mgnify:CR=1 FL=1
MPAELIDLETSLVVPPPPQEWLDKLTRAYETARRLPKGPKTTRVEKLFLTLAEALGCIESGGVKYVTNNAGEVLRVPILPRNQSNRKLHPAVHGYAEPRAVARVTMYRKPLREED